MFPNFSDLGERQPPVGSSVQIFCDLSSASDELLKKLRSEKRRLRRLLKQRGFYA